MSSELVLRYLQIAFYASAIAVAWLTYWSAKRTLLNSVNTEYQKRVLDRLAEVSRRLWDEEHDREGGTLYTEFLAEIRERASKVSTAVVEGADFETWEYRLLIGGAPAFVNHLFRLATLWETDPFLPRHLRIPICDFLCERGQALWDASTETLTAHHNSLTGGSIQPGEAASREARAKAIEIAEGKGFGARQSEERLKEIRHNIQIYLESFNPLHGRRRDTKYARLKP